MLPAETKGGGEPVRSAYSVRDGAIRHRFCDEQGADFYIPSGRVALCCVLPNPSTL